MTMPMTAKETSYCWTFPGSPIRIHIPLDLISRLRTELVADSPGTETGGVLLGRAKNQTTLEIDDYAWVASKERPGRPYHLDESELERLRSVYTFVVGYFRTQQEDNLQLRDEEAGFVGKHFPESTNVVLLIRTAREPYTAGFFFWMKEGVLSPFSFMDFPFDADLLRLQAAPRGTEPRVTEPAQEVEMTLPLLAASVNDAAEQPVWERSPTRQRTLVAAAIVCAVLPLAGVAAFLLPHSTSGPLPKLPVTAAALPLHLAVEAQGNGLNIRWDTHSPVVSQAREGRLVIVEGDKRPRIIPLNPQLLTSGHVYYRSRADRIQLQLEIVDNSGKVLRESVLALSSKP